ncbi:MAG: hypothetical protein ACTSYA_04595 [Candidatus Kariarchaeaceae archaeon]
MYSFNFKDWKKDQRLRYSSLIWILVGWGMIRTAYTAFILLSEMTRNEKNPEPLFVALGYFIGIIKPIAEVSSVLLGEEISDLLFVHMATGGIIFAAGAWFSKKWVARNYEKSLTFDELLPDIITKKNETSRRIQMSEKMVKHSKTIFLVYILIMVVFLGMSLLEDTWVDHYMVNNWEVNLKHKQQGSATLYLIIWGYLYLSIQNSSFRSFKGVVKLAEKPRMHIFMIIIMTSEVIASFPFSPVGYEQVIGEEQSWLTIDKFFHVFLSIVLLFVFWSIFNGNVKLALIFTLVMHFGYELFQYGIQPIEVSSDSLIDETISFFSTVIASIYLLRTNEP